MQISLSVFSALWFCNDCIPLLVDYTPLIITGFSPYRKEKRKITDGDLHANKLVNKQRKIVPT